LWKCCHQACKQEHETAILFFCLEQPHCSPLVGHAVLQIETDEEIEDHYQLDQEFNNEPPAVWETNDA
jgi:hypothetical protein